MLNPDILANPERVRAGLRQPFLVLRDAFLPDFAEQLYEQLRSTDAWRAERHRDEHYEFERDRISLDAPDAPPALAAWYDYLRSPEMLEWVSGVSGRRSDGFTGFAGYYRGGHRLTRHNDMMSYPGEDGVKRVRTVTFSYYLTRNWRPEYGGRFVWDKPRAEILPEFNTLVLFVVGPQSNHWVEPVDWSVSEKRFSLSGWYTRRRGGDAGGVRKLNIRMD